MDLDDKSLLMIYNKVKSFLSHVSEDKNEKTYFELVNNLIYDLIAFKE